MESPFKVDILKDKVDLLTGGGSGIRFEISTQFGKHGASVAIMGHWKSIIDDAVSALQSLGIPEVRFEGDVRNREDANNVVKETVKHFGKLHLVLQIGQPKARVFEETEERQAAQKNPDNEASITNGHIPHGWRSCCGKKMHWNGPIEKKSQSSQSCSCLFWKISDFVCFLLLFFTLAFY